MAHSTDSVFVGADVLEIMSVAMYAEPLVVYRELVQNAADAIDEAVAAGLMGEGNGVVRVSFDRASRSVVISDNGIGVENNLFVEKMLAFGASAKRHDNYRGFRGIGRLAGLGHCRELVFRSRSKGDRYVSEARWDCIKVRDLMLGSDIVPLEQLAIDAVKFDRVRVTDELPHFFEVRLIGVRRLADDRLFDPARIADFLSQVAPVPFSPQFSRGAEIRETLLRRAPLLEVRLVVDRTVIYKPYRDTIEVRSGHIATIREIESVEVPSMDQPTAAFGWIAHHEYLGALKPGYAARGLRVRSGNLQIGDDTILAKAFPEERFNAWAIGEFHVFDSRLRPNARRDAFEPSVHVDNLFNQLRPYAATIAKRCRSESKTRNDLKRVAVVTKALDSIDAALRRSATPLADAVRALVASGLRNSIDELRDANADADLTTVKKLASLQRRVGKLAERRATNRRLSALDRGRLDVLSWLQANGHQSLLTEAIVAMTRRGR